MPVNMEAPKMKLSEDKNVYVTLTDEGDILRPLRNICLQYANRAERLLTRKPRNPNKPPATAKSYQYCRLAAKNIEQLLLQGEL